MTRPGKIPSQSGFEPRIFRPRGGHLDHNASEVASKSKTYMEKDLVIHRQVEFKSLSCAVGYIQPRQACFILTYIAESVVTKNSSNQFNKCLL